MMPFAGVEVNQLHDKFYRKYEVYTMAWRNIDLSTLMVAGAPSGGPVAMVRDTSQILRATAETKSVIKIYTSAGAMISELAVLPKFAVNSTLLQCRIAVGTSQPTEAHGVD